MGTSKQRYTREQVETALVECGGRLFLAAERLGCTSSTICNYMARYPSIRKVVLEKRGRRVDVGESMLDRAVEAGEGWAIQFLLRTQGRDRGYVDRTEHTGEGGGPIEVRVISVVRGPAAQEQLTNGERTIKLSGPAGNGEPAT